MKQFISRFVLIYHDWSIVDVYKSTIINQPISVEDLTWSSDSFYFNFGNCLSWRFEAAPVAGGWAEHLSLTFFFQENGFKLRL